MSKQTEQIEHDTTCQRCGGHVPAGTSKYLLPGPRIMCEPCKAGAKEAYGNYKRGVFESNRRRREKEYLEREAFTSEGGALGPVHECAQCGEDYVIDRPHYTTNVATRDLCDTCEHIVDSARIFEWDLRAKHGQTTAQLVGRRGARAENSSPQRALR